VPSLLSAPPPLSPAQADPVKARAGRLGAAARWRDPANRRMVRLDALSPAERALVVALVDAAEKKKAAPGEAAPETADAEGQGHDRTAP